MLWLTSQPWIPARSPCKSIFDPQCVCGLLPSWYTDYRLDPPTACFLVDLQEDESGGAVRTGRLSLYVLIEMPLLCHLSSICLCQTLAMASTSLCTASQDTPLVFPLPRDNPTTALLAIMPGKRPCQTVPGSPRSLCSIYEHCSVLIFLGFRCSFANGVYM